MEKTPEATRGIEEEMTKEKYGRNIFQRDIYFRHGEKLPTGELAPTGFEQAKIAGEEMETTLKGPKVYHSEVKRAEDFGKTIQEATKSQKAYKARMRLEIGMTGYSKDFLKKWSEMTKEKGANGVMQWWLDFGKEKPDPESISPYEIASRFAKHALTHTKMTERYYSGSKVDMINASHGSIMEPFVAFALGDQIEKDPVNSEGKNLVEKMGGAFTTAESFEIDTSINEEGKKTLKVKLRGKEYDLPEEKLEELARFSELEGHVDKEERADVLVKEGKLEEASKLYLAAARQATNFYMKERYYQKATKTFEKLGKLEEVVKSYETEEDPENWYELAAEIWEKLGDN